MSKKEFICNHYHKVGIQRKIGEERKGRYESTVSFRKMLEDMVIKKKRGQEMVFIAPKHPLRVQRELRGWSQIRLAELLGTRSKSISQWERGVFLPSPYFREKLCALFEMDAQTLGFLAKTNTENLYFYDPLIPLQGLPPSGLIGRDTLLSFLKKKLCVRPYPPIITLHGLPGVGKTALLQALVHMPSLREYFSGGILWAGLGFHPDLFGLLFRWGKLLQISQEELQCMKDCSSLARCLRSHIGSRKLLIVLDDIWHLEDAQVLKIGGANCAYLGTTRFPGVAVRLSSQHVIHVPELEVRQGKALLTRFLPHFSTYESEAIEQLVQKVGMLPLALTLIGKHLYPYDYLRQSQDLKQAVQHLLDVSTRLHLGQPQSLVEHHPSIPPEHSLSLEAAIAVSVHTLSPEAQSALRSLSIVPAKPNCFSREFAEALIPSSPEALDDLLDTGLVENYGRGRYTIHQTIADYASTFIAKGMASSIAGQAIQSAPSQINTVSDVFDDVEAGMYQRSSAT